MDIRLAPVGLVGHQRSLDGGEEPVFPDSARCTEFRERRLRLELTPEEVAARLGCSAEDVRAIESGHLALADDAMWDEAFARMVAAVLNVGVREDSAEDESGDGDCICDFGSMCGGAGVLECDGCGGDFCVCAACYGNGEVECPGCDACELDDGDADIGGGG